MLHAYYKIALRSLLKSRLFSLLNLSGLALGLAVSLLLALYIRDERSFDRFHQNQERIYRVGVTARFDGKTQQWGNAPNVVEPAMKAGIAAVAQQTRWL
jgi:putative ABC transport system permease protein